MPRTSRPWRLIACAAALFGGTARAAEAPPARKPNLVLIVADDKD